VGGPLQGTVNYYRPTLEGVVYRPFGAKSAAGLRAQYGFIQVFGSTREIPYYERYFLGGENQIRGYDIRTVAPYIPTSGTLVGGDEFLLFNAEYYFDIAAPLRFVLFYDAGEAYLEGQNVNLRTLRTSTGAELRFLVPILNVPFRLIFAYNANRDYFQPATAFKFAIGVPF
jgi:outer membrane protein insertion porin family